MVHVNRVARARSEAIAEDELEHLARIYNLLGNPTRLKIVMALKSSEMCVCDMAAFIGLSESAVSHQLRRLKDLALVRKRRAGQILYYSLNDAHVSDLLDIGLEHIRE
jgi:DNA-binding transcriptional ArsR family regulator